MAMAYAAAWFCLLLTFCNFISIKIAAIRARPRPTPLPSARAAPGVSVVRPLCGLDNFCDETLESSFRLDYPSYEIIFCVARINDPVVPLVQRLIAKHPGIPARLIVGDEKVSANPKLNNCVKGWDAARYNWIILADANVLMPRDYIQRLLAGWRRRTGLVCSMPLAEIIEDALATKLVRRQGLTINLVDSPFEQPLGMRIAAEVWSRQTRWARTRRKSFPIFYAPEIFAGAALPCIEAAYAAINLDVSVTATVFCVALAWYVPEIFLAKTLKWHSSWKMPLLFILRDLLLPFVYIDAWCTDQFVWRGNEMSVREEEPSVERG